VIYLLGLLARAGHGKTTVARHLVDTRGAEVRSLAGPLKRAVRTVFGLSDDQLWGDQAAKEAIDPRYGFSARWLLQRLGTEGLRDEFGEDVHLQALLRGLRAEMAARAPDVAARLYVVDDVRFPNDARFIAEGGPDFRGAVLKIVSTDAPAVGSGGHASEQAIDAVRVEDVAATVTSSRALGLGHLLGGVDAALLTSAFDGIRPALISRRP
jgi:hypothetical protein